MRLTYVDGSAAAACIVRSAAQLASLAIDEQTLKGISLTSAAAVKREHRRDVESVCECA